MSKPINQIQPTALWSHFAALNAVPRPSKKEGAAIQFIYDFGKKLKLSTYKDKVGNVIIKKPGTKGFEKSTPIILQGHIDMVAQKNKDTDFDFDTMGIQMYIDGDWVKAKGTTLGADNGIGVAAIMAVLSSKELKHPPIEALFTMDEETGMTGAFALQPGLLDGKTLLNLDSEDETEMTFGCAGGVDVNIKNTYTKKSPTGQAFLLSVKGLKGGHSGMDIHLGRANANKILTRLLWKSSLDFGLKIASIHGGGLRNAIPREGEAKVFVAASKIKSWVAYLESEIAAIKNEYRTTDPDLTITRTPTRPTKSVMDKKSQELLLSALYACPNGIHRMSPDVGNLVQTSNNLAEIIVKNGKIIIRNLTRGAVDSEKMDLARAIQACFMMTGASCTFKGAYPGWAPEPKAAINTIMSKVYKKQFRKKPAIVACHAGLECGIIKKQYPDVEMISFGPNIRGAHSPDERVQISSVSRFWDLLKSTLQALG